jgi:hypothetical protein
MADIGRHMPLYKKVQELVQTMKKAVAHAGVTFEVK